MFPRNQTFQREGHPVPGSHSACASSSQAAGNIGDARSKSPEEAEISALLRRLASVPDPRSPQGKQHEMQFVLAVCVVATLVGAKNYREIASHATEMPQELLRKLGSEWCWFGRRYKYPSKSTIRNVPGRRRRLSPGSSRRIPGTGWPIRSSSAVVAVRSWSCPSVSERRRGTLPRRGLPGRRSVPPPGGASPRG